MLDQYTAFELGVTEAFHADGPHLTLHAVYHQTWSPILVDAGMGGLDILINLDKLDWAAPSSPDLFLVHGCNLFANSKMLQEDTQAVSATE